jgi:outer membrane cobalamin receptor
MRAILLAALISVAAAPTLRTQEPADSVAARQADSLAARRADSLAAGADTLRSPRREGRRPQAPPRVPADSLAGQAAVDSLAGRLPDSLAGLPDSTRQKIRERTPIFPDDIDPYTPLGLGRPTRVVEREELKGWAASSLAEILPHLYALALDEQGGPGFFGDLRLPSGLSGATRLLIDGRPLEGPMGPAADLRTIPITAVERIEIRSGAAALPGGAEAGSINIVTRTHLTPQANSGLSFDLGSQDREAFAGGLGRWLGSRFSALVTLRFDDGNTLTQVASAKTSQFWGKARLYLSRRHFVELEYGTSEATTESGTTSASDLSPLVGSEDRRERRFQAIYRGRVGPALASASFYADRFEEREVFSVDEFPLLTGKADRRGARATVRIGLGHGVAEAGAEWQKEKLDSDSPAFQDASGNGLADSTGFDDTRNRIVGLAGLEQEIDSLSVSAHARVERIEAAGETTVEPTVSAEARYRAPGGVSPFVRVARGARYPSFVEAAAFARAVGADAVRLATVEELRAGSGWRRGGISAEVGAFARRGSDVSLWLPPTGWRSALGDETVRTDATEVPAGGFAEVNLLELRARGVEVGVELPLPFGVVGEGFGLVQSVEDDAGRRVPYVAQAQALGRLTHRRSFFQSRNLTVRAALDTRISGPRKTLTGEDLPAFAQMDMLLRAQLIGFTAGLGVQNVFDQRVRTEEGFALPGRLVEFQLFWEFWN